MKCFLDECCCSILHLPSLYILISIFICTSPDAKKTRYTYFGRLWQISLGDALALCILKTRNEVLSEWVPIGEYLRITETK